MLYSQVIQHCLKTNVKAADFESQVQLHVALVRLHGELLHIDKAYDAGKQGIKLVRKAKRRKEDVVIPSEAELFRCTHQARITRNNLAKLETCRQEAEQHPERASQILEHMADECTQLPFPHHRRAVKYYKAALARVPGDDCIRRATLTMSVGLTHMDLHDWAAAVDEFLLELELRQAAPETNERLCLEAMTQLLRALMELETVDRQKVNLDALQQQTRGWVQQGGRSSAAVDAVGAWRELVLTHDDEDVDIELLQQLLDSLPATSTPPSSDADESIPGLPAFEVYKDSDGTVDEDTFAFTDDEVAPRVAPKNRLRVKNELGEYPLQQAAKAGQLSKVLDYLQQGAVVGDRDNAGWTAIHDSVVQGHEDVLRVLLEHDASSVNAKSNAEGGVLTALHEAVQLERLPVIALLLEHGARTTVENAEGVNPMDLAVLQGRTEAFQALLNYEQGLAVEQGRELPYHDEDSYEAWRSAKDPTLFVEEVEPEGKNAPRAAKSKANLWFQARYELMELRQRLDLQQVNALATTL